MGKSLVSCFLDSRCTLHLHAQTLREDRTRSCGDVLADRQTDRQTDTPTNRRAHHNTLSPVSFSFVACTRTTRLIGL